MRLTGLTSTLLIQLILFTGKYHAICQPAGSELERKVDSVLALMTLEEKLGQMTLLTSDWDVTGPTMRDDYMEAIRSGRCGNVFNAHTVEYNRMLQKTALEETRLGIPLLFGYDVIHGHKTIFPIPLAEACSWNLELLEKSAALAAREAAASGLNWTFAPMVDISRDPRWGRVSEGNGEDPYLASQIAAARVRGFQGEDLSDALTIAACIKHFAAYGAPLGGRDYNTVSISEMAFRQTYLPPYRSGIEAGAATVMAAFNDFLGVPATASPLLLTTMLREEMDFTGFVVSDYTAIYELINHRVAGDRTHAGVLALKAGIDMDMQSSIFLETLTGPVEEGEVSMEEIDEAVRRILRIKFRLGLFQDPYRYLDQERENEIVYSDEIMEHALQSARESVVLLKNDPVNGTPILPLDSPARIAVIGPLGDNRIDMLGSWHAAGDASRVVTLVEGLKKKFPSARIAFEKGADFLADDRFGFHRAIELARQSEVVLLAIGESQALGGEAASRSMIGIPGIQEELALELIETGVPVVVLIMAERPLTFPDLNARAGAILYAWHLGTRAGDALADIIAGDYNPSGKLVMSIPVNVGQVPVLYNEKSTGRPMDPENKYTSKYLDAPNAPLYPFGYGLSYTRFDYGDIRLEKNSMGWHDTLDITVAITNSGEMDGEEVVQLYIRDEVASITLPVKELKGFRKIFLAKGESREVKFSLTRDDLQFVNGEMKWIAEPGDFQVMIGPDSGRLKMASFTLENP
jgi:beta-glucosidase